MQHTAGQGGVGEGPQFVIKGRVVDATSHRGASGLRVEAWDKDLLVDDFIGKANATAANGGFTIEFDERHFRGLFGERHPDLFFRVYDGQTQLLQTDPLLRAVGLRSAAPGTGDAVQLPGPQVYEVQILLDAPPASLSPTHRVHGRVTQSDGCAVAQAVVRAFGRAAGREMALGDAVTDAAGGYEIGYAPRHDHDLALPALDALVVRAVDAGLLGTATSQERAQPRPDEKVDLQMAARKPPVAEAGTPGRFVHGCQIDLPPGDVVERVDYDQIITTRNTLAELKAQWGAGWPVLSDAWWDRYAECQLGLYLPFEQSWALQGYTRGRMVKSFSLAPGEEQTVEVYTWDRKKSALESTSTAESEQTTEATGTRRDALDVSQDVARQTGFQMSTGGKVGFSLANSVNVDMNQSVTASTNANEHATTASHAIAEATTRASGKVRSSRTVKVTESREYGSEERVTRKLRNANAYHTLNVAFFEILAHYRVTTSMHAGGVKLVLLMPDPLQPSQPQDRRFGRRTVRQHERALRLALLDRELEPGFDAARVLDAYDRSCGVLCNSCPCPDDPGFEPRNWRRLLNCAKELSVAWQATADWKAMAPEELHAAAAFLALDHVHAVIDKLTPPHPDHDGFVNRVTGAIQDDLKSRLIQGRYTGAAQAEAYIRSYLFREALRTRAGDLQGALRVALTDPARAMSQGQADVLGTSLTGLPAGALDALSGDPVVAASAHGSIETAFLGIAPAIARLDPLSFLATAGVSKMLADRVTADVDDFLAYDLLGLAPLLKLFVKVYPDWLKDLAADDAANQAAAEQVRTDRQERAARVLAAFGLREIVENQERLDALLGHLNDDANLDHYRFAVASERKALFAASEDGLKLVAGGVLEAMPVGSLGDRFAVPVRLPSGAPFQASFNAIRDALANWITPDEREHILPTAALYSEAIVGQCNAAEPEVLELHRLEVQRRDIDNDLQSLEAARLRARLQARPALLDRDPAQPTRIGLDLVSPTGSTAGATTGPA